MAATVVPVVPVNLVAVVLDQQVPAGAVAGLAVRAQMAGTACRTNLTLRRMAGVVQAPAVTVLPVVLVLREIAFQETRISIGSTRERVTAQFREACMQIKYRILEKDEQSQAIVVRFTTSKLDDAALSANEEELRDTEVDGVIAPRWFPKLRNDGSPSRCRTDVRIELPLPIPSGEELHLFIMQSAPAGWLEREERVRFSEDNANALSHINVGDSHERDFETLRNDLKVRAILASKAESDV
jgi:hypothetical protein